MKKTLICDIARASFHDGPGIRTIVYFKGCPLNCAWCHNPECISFEAEELFYADKCIGCNMCSRGCFSGARVVCGKEMSPEALTQELLRDRDYFGKDGGVTFSGGEPLAHVDYLRQVVSLLENEGINSAVETSLCYFDAKLLSRMQVVMADFKIWDSNLHKKYTGIGNEIILENFLKLDKLGVPIIARTPVIPEIDQNIERISDFLRSLKNVKKYELLKYHPLGRTKYAALGREFERFSIPDAEYFTEINKYAFDLL